MHKHTFNNPDITKFNQTYMNLYKYKMYLYLYACTHTHTHYYITKLHNYLDYAILNLLLYYN